MYRLFLILIISFPAFAGQYDGHDSDSWNDSFCAGGSTGGGLCPHQEPQQFFKAYWTNGSHSCENTYYRSAAAACSGCNAVSPTYAPFKSGGDYTNPVYTSGNSIPAGNCYEINRDYAYNPLGLRVFNCAVEGQEFDDASQLCIDPPEECPAGQQSITVGTESQCVPTFEEPECDNPLGEFNGKTLCADERDECEATGGTYGFAGEGTEFNKVCLPSEFDDQLPTCSDTNAVQLTENGFVCSSGTPAEEQQTPFQENPTPSDIDDDGIPDNNDDDIDGDGLANSVDTDTDGDGIPDADDPTPNGESEGEENEVNGGGTCETRPACTGDAVQCAILFQTWATRCESTESETEELTQSDVDTLTAGNDPSQLTAPGVDLTTTLSGIYDQTSAAASCPADEQITVVGTTLAISYQPFCDLAAFIKPVVILLFSLIAFRTVMRAF